MYWEGFTLGVRTRIGLQRIEVINKTLVNHDFPKKKIEFSIYSCLESLFLKILAFKVIRVRIYNT